MIYYSLERWWQLYRCQCDASSAPKVHRNFNERWMHDCTTTITITSQEGKSLWFTYMLCIAGVMREKGGNMEHYLPVFVLGIDGSLSSLVVSDIQTSSIPSINNIRGIIRHHQAKPGRPYYYYEAESKLVSRPPRYLLKPLDNTYQHQNKQLTSKDTFGFTRTILITGTHNYDQPSITLIRILDTWKVTCCWKQGRIFGYTA